MEILLLRIRLPGLREAFWIAPGGGLEAGEGVSEALTRELSEELGLNDFTPGPLVWRRQHTFNWAGQRICQRERYYVIHASRFEPKMSDRTESQTLDHFRWWPVTELATATERLTPLSLADIISRYLREGPPQEPVQMEVLVD